MTNYIPFFESKKLQVVYVPRETDGEYSKLYLELSPKILRFISSKNIFGAGVALFLFVKQLLFFVIGIFILFFILSYNKGLAKKLHLLIPVIVYSKMSETEIKNFLKRNPQFGEQEVNQKVTDSKIVQEIDDDVSEKVKNIFQEKVLKNDKIEDRMNSGASKTSSIQDSVIGNKSIFDDYESVMDKFSKK